MIGKEDDVIADKGFLSTDILIMLTNYLSTIQTKK